MQMKNEHRPCSLLSFHPPEIWCNSADWLLQECCHWATIKTKCSSLRVHTGLLAIVIGHPAYCQYSKFRRMDGDTRWLGLARSLAQMPTCFLHFSFLTHKFWYLLPWSAASGAAMILWHSLHSIHVTPPTVYCELYLCFVFQYSARYGDDRRLPVFPMYISG